MKKQAMNPWHDVNIGKNCPKVVNAIVEIPMGSRNKYEFEKETGLIRLDRTLFSSVLYPGDYGFIPKTLWEDNDPLDILILTRFPSYPLVVIEAKPIGVVNMVDENESDDKILAIPTGDPFFRDIEDISELAHHTMREIRHFFEIYKELQDKVVRVQRFLGKKEAFETIEKGRELYEKKFPEKSKRL